MKKKKKNYLEFIPQHNEKFFFEINEEGLVTIFIENKGLFNRIAQKLFKKPKVSQVHLDEMGSFIYPLIDGKKSVMDLSVLVHDHFGEKAEPLYNRLVTYMAMLERYEFVIMNPPKMEE